MTSAWARADAGQSLVEMALMMPMLLLLLIGTIDAGIAVNSYVTVTNASREATQYAIQHPTAAPAAIASAAVARSAPLQEASITVTTSYHNGATFVPWPAGGLPSGNPSATYVPVRVEVAYPWSASTILVGRFVQAVTFRGVSTMEALW